MNMHNTYIHCNLVCRYSYMYVCIYVYTYVKGSFDDLKHLKLKCVNNYHILVCTSLQVDFLIVNATTTLQNYMCKHKSGIRMVVYT